MGTIFFIIPILLIFIAILLLVPDMNFNNIRPVLYKGMKPVIGGAYEVLIYPFGETVIFTVAFSTLKDKKSIYKIYILSFLIGGMFLLATSLTIILVLGINTTSNMYFPTYDAVARINIGNFLQRLEIISAIVFVIGIFVKVSIYLLASCKGFAKIFGCKDYRFIVTPISLLAINLAYLEFDSIMSFNEWIFDVWIYYAFVFMVILPVIILIVAEIKKKRLVIN